MVSLYLSLIHIYNYYVKLIKKLKKHIKDSSDIQFYTRYDKFNNLVCLVSKFDINEIYINLNIDIRIIIGDKYDTYMKATYYQEKCGDVYKRQILISWICKEYTKRIR